MIVHNVFRLIYERYCMINMAQNFSNSEMCDMILIYGECGQRPRKAAKLYARRYPRRAKSNHVFFMRLESRLRRDGQFKLVKRPGTYLFIKVFGNTILNIVFLSLLSLFSS